jgi:hypothetical protein
MRRDLNTRLSAGNFVQFSMAVVAAVSSVAGIASLVGQSLNGLTKLYDFFQGCQNISKTISRFLSELTSLEKVIREVEDLVSKIGNSLQKPEESILISLTFHLEDCAKDLASWFNFVHEQHLSRKSSAITIFKKILVAIKSKDIKDIFTQISSHRQGISMSLSATGRYVV